MYLRKHKFFSHKMGIISRTFRSYRYGLSTTKFLYLVLNRLVYRDFLYYISISSFPTYALSTDLLFDHIVAVLRQIRKKVEQILTVQCLGV